MKDTKTKKDRKKVKIAFMLVIGCLIVVFIVAAATYAQTQQNWLMWVGVADLILFTIGLISFSFIVWSWDIKDLMTEYKEKTICLAAG